MLVALGLIVRTPVDLYYLLPLACIALMLRMPLRIAAVIVGVVSITVLWLTSIGAGPLQRVTPYETFLAAIVFVAAMNIVAYGIGLLWHDVLWQQGHLEELVRERTSELQHANAALERLSRVDELTSSWNRRHFDACFRRECERAHRNGGWLCLVAIDIDHFKAINDTYGHAVGDEVLKQMAARLGDTLRGADVLGRIGGEEFIAMLIDCNPAQGSYTAERLRQVVAEQPFEAADAFIPVRISAGVVSFRPSTWAGSIDEMCAGVRELADRRLYAAKTGGRDRVVAGAELETEL